MCEMAPRTVPAGVWNAKRNRAHRKNRRWLGYNHRVFSARSSRRLTRRNDSGGTAVEFALVFPIAAVLLFGMIDGGRLVIDRFMVSYAAVVGGRVASVRATTSVTAVQTAVVAAVPFLGLSSSNVSVSVNGVAQTDATFAGKPTGVPSTNKVTVTVTYDYQAVFIPLYNRAVKTLTGTSQVGIE
jgi:Flp pilus assembly protein TadG